MSTISDEKAVENFLNELPPAATAAFREAGDLLARHLAALAYREHRGLLLQDTAFRPFLGRCFLSKDRIVCLTLRDPDGTLELWVDEPKDPADPERSLLLHFPSGWRDFQYLTVEEEANPQLLGGLKREEHEPAAFPRYLEKLLHTPHLDLILRGKLRHGYFFDPRELYLGDYSVKTLADSLRKSLREQGFES